MPNILYYITVLLFFAATVLTDECPPCTCQIFYEAPSIDCKRDLLRKSVYSIPQLDTKLPLNKFQELILTNQPLKILPDNAFSKVNLLRLKYIFLKNCTISTINDTAFNELTELIELDLSYNKISKLSDAVFKPTIILRFLYLNNNQLEFINNKLFEGLSHLQKITLSSNRIKHIEDSVFMTNSMLINLDLSHNELKYLNTSIVKNFSVLNTVTLHENPWICDCQLRDLFDKISMDKFSQFLDTLRCSAPETLRQKSWSDLYSDNFTCWLRILQETESITVTRRNGEITLSCLVESSPGPTGKWLHNETKINVTEDSKYRIKPSQVNQIQYWWNLTISKVGKEDMGVYKCRMKNPRTFTIVEKKIFVKLIEKTKVMISYIVPVTIGCTTFFISVLIIFFKCTIRYTATHSAEHNYKDTELFDEE